MILFNSYFHEIFLKPESINLWGFFFQNKIVIFAVFSGREINIKLVQVFHYLKFTILHLGI